MKEAGTKGHLPSGFLHVECPEQVNPHSGKADYWLPGNGPRLRIRPRACHLTRRSPLTVLHAAPSTAGAASIPNRSLSPPTWGQAPPLPPALVPPCLRWLVPPSSALVPLGWGLDLEKLSDYVVTLSGGTRAATVSCTASPCLPSPRSAGGFLGCAVLPLACPLSPSSTPRDPILWDLKVPGFTAKLMSSVCLSTPKPQLAFRGPTQVVD